MSNVTQPREQALMALSKAALAISGQLSLDKTLQQIMDSARSLVAAKYAAVGVFSADGKVAGFFHSGITAEQAAAIPHWPEGRGLLKAILVRGESIRIPCIADDPRSVGFPPGHPQMTSLLGVPIIARDEALGNLYLADKIGADSFSAADQELIEMLATHAAIAIKNANLYKESIERERQLEARNQELAALNAVARSASRHLDLKQVISEVLEQVLQVTGMEVGEVFLLDESTGDMVLAFHQGPSAEAFHTINRFKRGDGFPGWVAENKEVRATTNLAKEASYLRRQVIEDGYNSYVCIPLRSKRRVVGTLGLSSRSRRAFTQRELELLEAIGNQSGVAVENARLYEQVGRLAIAEERSRIGMDLHDGVIQSIYAVGLTLEAARAELGDDPVDADSLIALAIDGLNDAIRDIRNFIMDLRPARFEGDLTAGLARLVREFQANATVPITVAAPAKFMDSLSASASQAIFLTTQEALANIARHAEARNVTLELNRDNAAIVLTVADDGIGFDPERQSQAVGHGLSNMRARAEHLGGTFEIQSAPQKGTTLRLSLPL